MSEKLHRALEAVVPHVGDGSQIFVHDNGSYHKFRVEGGRVSHTGSHSSTRVEHGRGGLPAAAGRKPGRKGPGGEAAGGR